MTFSHTYAIFFDGLQGVIPCNIYFARVLCLVLSPIFEMLFIVYYTRPFCNLVYGD